MRGKVRHNRKYRRALSILFSIVIFVILLIVLLLSGAIVNHLIGRGFISAKDESIAGVFAAVLLAIILTCIPVGGCCAFLASVLFMRPINKIINGMNRLAAGDFQTRIQFRAPFDQYPTVHELTESFNTLAAELEGTEILRSDFINSFSHEFKTPIVSIAGFAKLLRYGKISDEERKEYLSIIEEESMRLAAMSQSVLNLSKVENMMILTDTADYNLSEQIRNSVLLLIRKWEKKHIDMDLSFDEIMINGNEELLKEVWVNLLDNAVKFCPEYGQVKITIRQSPGVVKVSVTNTGSSIKEEQYEKIFQKFYQADESHTSEGNGIGLALVKKVVELHHGHVWVSCTEQAVTFTVDLPA